MIQIEIISPLTDLQGLWPWGGNFLIVGGKKGIPLAPDELGSIEVTNQGLLFTPFSSLKFFLLNSKRSTLPRILNPNDILQIEHTKLKIISFYETPASNKNEELRHKLEILKNSKDSLLEVVTVLTKV